MPFEGYTPTPEEDKKAQDMMGPHMGSHERTASDLREVLTDEQKELIKDFSLTEYNMPYGFESTIKGHSVKFTCESPYTSSPVHEGVVDGQRIPKDEAERLFYKYAKIAEYLHMQKLSKSEVEKKSTESEREEKPAWEDL
jgi:hypothetical protein